MPNQVTSHNDRTLLRAVDVLIEDCEMTFKEAMEVINRLLNAGLLIREPAERDDKDNKKIVGIDE